MLNPTELSDSDFLEWAGARSERWAALPLERRSAWLEHLIARMRAACDPDDRDECWRLASAIASADRDSVPAESSLGPD